MIKRKGKPAVDDVRKAIEALYSTLSGEVRRAARYSMDHSDEIGLYSMRKVARDAGVNPATMLRLAKALGYSSYNELRVPFQDALRVQRQNFPARAQRLRRATESLPIVEQILDNELVNVSSCADALSPSNLSRAEELLRSSRQIFVVGLRGMYSAAHLFHYACSKFSSKVVLLDGIGGTFPDAMRDLGAKDLVVVITSNRYAREAVRSAQFAQTAGARLIAITDNRLSPVAKMADVSFLVRSSGIGFMPSIIPVMVVVQALVAVFIAASGSGAQLELKRSERLLKYFSVFIDDREAGLD